MSDKMDRGDFISADKSLFSISKNTNENCIFRSLSLVE